MDSKGDNKISETQEKLDKLVSAYIDGDIPKENYLPRKEELLKQKVSLANDLEDFGQTGKNWLQPLRQWILDTKKADFLIKSDDFHEIKFFVQKIGTNPTLSDKIVSYNFVPPFNFLAEMNSKSFAEPRAKRGARQNSPAENLQSCVWWDMINKARTFFENR